MIETASKQLGVAFALVCLAGCCAPLGACVVLFMQKNHVKLLAASLALTAGVMVFISLTEVSKEGGQQACSTCTCSKCHCKYTGKAPQ